MVKNLCKNQFLIDDLITANVPGSSLPRRQQLFNLSHFVNTESVRRLTCVVSAQGVGRSAEQCSAFDTS
jgi:hypothetical protein